MTTEVKAPEKTNGKKETPSIKDYLQSQSMIAEIGKALPSHMKPERMARVAITALTRTPKLAKCTQASFFKCLLDLSAMGLEPDGRRAHLIPFDNKKNQTTECTLIIDYKGIVEMAYRSGWVKYIHADVVCDGDIFAYSLGRVTGHTPWAFRTDAAKPDSGGPVIAAYCLIELSGGATKCEVMTWGEIEAIRSRSFSAKSGPWVTDWNEMAKKTVFKRASKWIPLSAEILDALDRDDDRFEPLPSIGYSKAAMKSIEDLTAEPETDDESSDELQAASTGDQ